MKLLPRETAESSPLFSSSLFLPPRSPPPRFLPLYPFATKGWVGLARSFVLPQGCCARRVRDDDSRITNISSRTKEANRSVDVVSTWHLIIEHVNLQYEKYVRAFFFFFSKIYSCNKRIKVLRKFAVSLN